MEAQRGAMLAWMQEIAPYGIFTTDAALNVRSWNQWLVTHSGLPSHVVLGRPLAVIFPHVKERGLEAHFYRALSGEISVLSTALHKFLLPLPSTVRGYDVAHMLQTVRIAPLSLGNQVVGTITTIEDVTQRECQAATLHRQQVRDQLLSSTLALLLESETPLQAVTELFPRIAGPLKLEAYFNYLLTPDEKELRLHAAGGIPPDVRRTLAVLPVGEGISAYMARQRTPIVLPHVQTANDPAADAVRRLGLRSFAGFPLLIGERLLGTLSFGSYARDTIAPDEVEFLSTLAQYLSIAIDRSQREHALREAQQSLREHAGTLETKIAERTAALHETIAQLESFSYTIAHDLRAPIRSLKGYSEILLSDFSGAIPPDAQALVHRLQRASNRLDALTRDLLKFSKITREDVQLTPVDVTELVHDLVLVTPALQGNVIRIEGDLGSVWAQRTLLQQCFSNLFDNALKFSGPGVIPHITLRSELATEATRPSSSGSNMPFNPSIFHQSQRPSGHAGPTKPPSSSPEETAPRRRIWIVDNGIGIPPQAHEKIFGIFERVSGLETVEGTGIGLAIVARAMQQMGGTCGVESEVGAGSRFWLELASAEQA